MGLKWILGIMLIFLDTISPILCIVQFFFRVDYLHVQSHKNIVSIGHMEYRDTRHEMDFRLLPYSRHNYGSLCANILRRASHILC